MKKKDNVKQYVIGVDGGGTKTTAVLADLRAKILKRVETGSTNPNKIGLEKAVLNLKNLILEISKNCPKGKIKLVYLGLAGGLERNKKKQKEIKRILEKRFPFPIKVEGDQKIAFRSGTDEKEGVLIIAGTGSISIGWRKKKEAISGGWDWLLGDQGSAFWVGKKALEETLKSTDGRRKPLSKMQKLLFRKRKKRVKAEESLYQEFYNFDFVERVAFVSKIVERAAGENDRFAKDILKEAGKELAQMAVSVIKKLNFQKMKFSTVLIGGMFNSKIVTETVKKEVKKSAAKAEFIRPKTEPVIGAVKLALEEVKFLKK